MNSTSSCVHSSFEIQLCTLTQELSHGC